MKRVLLLLMALPCAARAQNLRGDEALSKVLIEGEGWTQVAQGLGFCDAATSDANGDFYFSDMRNRTIYRVDQAGKVTPFWSSAPAISGMKLLGGRLFAATQQPGKQIIAVDPATKAITVLADAVTPNDLVVTRGGRVYYTDTNAVQVALVDGGKRRVVASGITRPNGIALTPDEGTLAVSEHGGDKVWTFRVEASGELTAGMPYMELRTPVGRRESGGDGMTTDVHGRYYVTSTLGLQMFDWTGRLGGVIAKPGNIVSVTFAGPERAYLYVCAGDRVLRRKTTAQAPLPK